MSGKKAAECVQYELTAVPRGLSPELQSVDLSQNPLQLLPRDAFREVGLVNLHKLFLRDCGIRDLHQEAFSGLEILIELDLTANQVRRWWRYPSQPVPLASRGVATARH